MTVRQPGVSPIDKLFAIMTSNKVYEESKEQDRTLAELFSTLPK